MKFLYQRFTWLSFDVVLGAMGGMLFFSKMLRVPIDWDIYLLLGMAVWAIYTFDHLMDSQKHEIGEEMDRHGFHRKYTKTLVPILALVILFGMFWAYQVFGNGPELYSGAFLGLIILILMLIIRVLPTNLHWLKEFNTAIFYVIGIALLPFLRFSFVEWTWEVGLLIFGYTGLAYLNLIMLSWLDASKDKAAGFGSLISVLTPDRVILVVRWLTFGIVFIFLITLFFAASHFRVFASLILLIALVHYLSFFNQKLNSNQIRRSLDASFLIPWLLLFF